MQTTSHIENDDIDFCETVKHYNLTFLYHLSTQHFYIVKMNLYTAHYDCCPNHYGFKSQIRQKSMCKTKMLLLWIIITMILKIIAFYLTRI